MKETCSERLGACDRSRREKVGKYWGKLHRTKIDSNMDRKGVAKKTPDDGLVNANWRLMEGR